MNKLTSIRSLHLNSLLVLLCGLPYIGRAQAEQPDGVAPAAVTNITGQTNSSGVKADDADSNADDYDWYWNQWKGPGVRRETIVAIRKDAELKAGDAAEAVVAVGGSASALGPVRDQVVAVAGDVDIQSRANNAVAVLGNIRAGQGARLRRDLVAVFGNVKIDKGAKIRGDVVAIGGKGDIEEGAVVEGRVHEIDLGALGLPRLTWLRGWFTHCFLLMRPLAPQVGWVWVIAI